MGFWAIVDLGYVAGVLICLTTVFRVRAGISVWGRLNLEFAFNNLPWFLATIAKSFLWPVVLLYWLAQGRPPSPWKVVREKSGVLIVRRVGEKLDNIVRP